ncbi:MAG: V-type ATP synthase subunit B, partial [Dehalococcoidales bacterium]
EISTIVGTDALSDRDKIYLEIADRFENEFISQGENEKRTIEETLDIGWRLFSALPEEDLKLVSQDLITKYLPKYRENTGN